MLTSLVAVENIVANGRERLVSMAGLRWGERRA